MRLAMNLMEVREITHAKWGVQLRFFSRENLYQFFIGSSIFNMSLGVAYLFLKMGSKLSLPNLQKHVYDSS